ncbi:hypothetical protein GPO78_001572 [Salmonella enterica]|nr:hypothetical protein [Salmonella enterica]
MTDDFAADGQLAKAITGFKPREPQRQMAVAVTQAIENAQPLVVEAGTGTGKTYAYLAPALRAGKKVIISTGSKALQDQLYSRDLPTVAKALAFTGKTALLKGRSNYLCLERLEQQALAGGDLPFTSPDDPLLKARMEDCRLRGGDPFDEVQLPDAVITLKQGVGRLIRDADDRGVLVICDNRLVMRPYGATFLASLPPAPRTRDIARAVRFLAIPSAE